MKRREFLSTSLATTALAALSPLAAKGAQPAASSRELYELRLYRLKEGSGADGLGEYLAKAAIPAWNRLGSRPIGVFTDKEQKEPGLFVLIPHSSAEAFVAAAANLERDEEYRAAGAAYLNRPKANPVFERMDSWLLLAFKGMPKLELPAYSRERRPRLFELRTYESYSERKAASKVDMFNSGEIDAMHEVGLAPIFFGEGLSGPGLPHLTYMTSAPDEGAHKEHWDAFGKHPTWDKLKNDPKYADTVSKINRWILLPTAYSQI